MMMKHVIAYCPPFLALLLLVPSLRAGEPAKQMEWVQVATDRSGFVLSPSGKRFVPWGFNYDHDEKSRLLEDYWESEWPKVVEDFREMKALGANVVRVHLQVAKFMDAADKPNDKALAQLEKLLKLAEETGLSLDITGLGCYRKSDVPGWYDALSERDRWAVQARFWEAVAQRCAGSRAVFFYDLMNEPIAPTGQAAKDKPTTWLPGKPFGGFHFVQTISLDRGDRARPEVARQWVAHLVKAIRKHDRRHLISVGLVPWSLDRPGLSSGFVPDKIAGDLDFICVHLYPRSGKIAEAIETLKGFAVGKPVVIEETFPLNCSPAEWKQFYEQSKKHAHGWIGFYWGKTLEEYRGSKTFGDVFMRAWLEFFRQEAERIQSKVPNGN